MIRTSSPAVVTRPSSWCYSNKILSIGSCTSSSVPKPTGPTSSLVRSVSILTGFVSGNPLPAVSSEMEKVQNKSGLFHILSGGVPKPGGAAIATEPAVTVGAVSS